MKAIHELVCEEILKTFARDIEDLECFPRLGMPVPKITPGEYKAAFIKGLKLALGELSQPVEIER